MPNKEAKYAREAQNRAFRSDRKAERAHRRRARLEEAENQLLQDLQNVQFDRALGKVMDGKGTPEDVGYVLKKIGDYEDPMERFRIKRISGNGETETEVTIAEVVFDRSDKAISPEGNELEANIA